MTSTANPTSHWHHSVEQLNTSTLDFYNSLEAALKAKEAPVKTERVAMGEGSILSPKRTYLRVSFQRDVFDIGAFPFGQDFFFSWWLGPRKSGGVLGVIDEEVVHSFVASRWAGGLKSSAL